MLRDAPNLANLPYQAHSALTSHVEHVTTAAAKQPSHQCRAYTARRTCSEVTGCPLLFSISKCPHSPSFEQIALFFRLLQQHRYHTCTASRQYVPGTRYARSAGREAVVCVKVMTHYRHPTDEFPRKCSGHSQVQTTLLSLLTAVQSKFIAFHLSYIHVVSPQHRSSARLRFAGARKTLDSS